MYGSAWCLSPPRRGGGGEGGVLGIYIGGGGPGTKRGGVLGAGTAPKRGGGVLGAGTIRKRGLRHIYNPKKGEFRTDLVEREGARNWNCSKGGLGSLFIYYLYLYLSIWSTIVGVFLVDWKKGVLGAGTARKRGFLCAGPTQKGGLRCGSCKKVFFLPRHIPMLNIYVSAPLFTTLYLVMNTGQHIHYIQMF